MIDLKLLFIRPQILVQLTKMSKLLVFDVMTGVQILIPPLYVRIFSVTCHLQSFQVTKLTI
jgi:hypothetical protein